MAEEQQLSSERGLDRRQWRARRGLETEDDAGERERSALSWATTSWFGEESGRDGWAVRSSKGDVKRHGVAGTTATMTGI